MSTRREEGEQQLEQQTPAIGEAGGCGGAAQSQSLETDAGMGEGGEIERGKP